MSRRQHRTLPPVDRGGMWPLWIALGCYLTGICFGVAVWNGWLG